VSLPEVDGTRVTRDRRLPGPFGLLFWPMLNCAPALVEKRYFHRDPWPSRHQAIQDYCSCAIRPVRRPVPGATNKPAMKNVLCGNDWRQNCIACSRHGRLHDASYGRQFIATQHMHFIAGLVRCSGTVFAPPYSRRTQSPCIAMSRRPWVSMVSLSLLLRCRGQYRSARTTTEWPWPRRGQRVTRAIDFNAKTTRASGPLSPHR